MQNWLCCLEIQNNLNSFYLIDVYQNATLADSFEDGGSRVIRNCCNNMMDQPPLAYYDMCRKISFSSYSSQQMHIVVVSMLVLAFGLIVINSLPIEESHRIKRQMPPPPPPPPPPRPCINGTAPGSGEEEAENEEEDPEAEERTRRGPKRGKKEQRQ